MSREALADFLTKASNDESVRTQLDGCATEADIARLGRASGFEIDPADLIPGAVGAGVLSDSQLDAVAGGFNVHGVIMNVMRESIKQTNEDKQFYLDKLKKLGL